VDPEARDASDVRHTVDDGERHSPERTLGEAVEEPGHDQQRRGAHETRYETEDGPALRLASGGERVQEVPIPSEEFFVLIAIAYSIAIIGATGPVPLDLIPPARLRELKAPGRDEYAPGRPPCSGMVQQVLFSPDGRVAHLRGRVVFLFEEMHLPLALNLVGMPRAEDSTASPGGTQPPPVAIKDIA
jgi:hypothetical protein